MLLDAREAYDALLSGEIGPLLLGSGFNRRGAKFRRSLGPNLVVVEAQKSVKSTRTQVLFTFNLMVFSAALALRVEGLGSLASPSAVPHWRQRLGFVLPSPADRWWEISGEDDIPALAAELCPALAKYAVPALLHAGSDEHLRDLWLTDRSPGLSELQRALNLSAMLVLIGPRELLPTVVKWLEAIPSSHPWYGTARRHLRRLEQLLEE